MTISYTFVKASGYKYIRCAADGTITGAGSSRNILAMARSTKPSEQILTIQQYHAKYPTKL